MRLHELAKELEANSKDLLRIAKEMGLPVRSHSSNLAPGEVALLKAAYRFGELDEEKLLARIESLEEEKHKKADEDKKAWLQKQSDKHHEEQAEKAKAAAVAEDAAATAAVAAAALDAAQGEEFDETGGEDEAADVAETEAAPARGSTVAPPAEASTSASGSPTPLRIEPVVTAGAAAASATGTAAAASAAPGPAPLDTKPRRVGARIVGRIELPTQQARPAAAASTQTMPDVAPGRITDEEAEREKRKTGKPKTKRWNDNTALEEIEASGAASPTARPKFWERGPQRRHARRGSRGPVQPSQTLPSQKKAAVTPPISIKDLSQLLGIKANDILLKFMMKGVKNLNINSLLDEEAVLQLALEFNREITIEAAQAAEDQLDRAASEAKTEEDPAHVVSRAPVVTFLGHVDHGKTSLLDRIRQSNVVATEAGGITQHIRAYRVMSAKGNPVVLLDTPGHRAFTQMRMRGARVTDICVLVVAADDGVMPQTEEALQHARAAAPDMPIVVALNKIDKPEANPMRVKQQLMALNLLPEEYGGNVGVVEVSAVTGQGIEELIDRIALEAEVRELKANPNKPAEGTVIEATKDDEIGIAVTVLVREGTLHVRDAFVCGATHGRVRAMYDDHNRLVEEALPSTPVRVVGFEDIPMSGDQLRVVEDLRLASDVATERRDKMRQANMQERHKVTLENLFESLDAGKVHEIRVVLKADVQGSLEVLRRELNDLKHAEVKIKIIRDALGGITEDDVLLAEASGAVVIGFNVVADEKARVAAEARGIEVRSYQIIYELIDEVKAAMEGVLRPTRREKINGRVEVRQVFKVSKLGNIAGCYVVQGFIQRNNKVRLIRDGKIIYTGDLDSLKRFKDDVREVKEGFECGLRIVGYDDVKVGDFVEPFEVVEEKRVLAL